MRISHLLSAHWHKSPEITQRTCNTSPRPPTNNKNKVKHFTYVHRKIKQSETKIMCMFPIARNGKYTVFFSHFVSHLSDTFHTKIFISGTDWFNQIKNTYFIIMRNMGSFHFCPCRTLYITYIHIFIRHRQ